MLQHFGFAENALPNIPNKRLFLQLEKLTFSIVLYIIYIIKYSIKNTLNTSITVHLPPAAIYTEEGHYKIMAESAFSSMQPS